MGGTSHLFAILTYRLRDKFQRVTIFECQMNKKCKYFALIVFPNKPILEENKC